MKSPVIAKCNFSFQHLKRKRQTKSRHLWETGQFVKNSNAQMSTGQLKGTFARKVSVCSRNSFFHTDMIRPLDKANAVLYECLLNAHMYFTCLWKPNSLFYTFEFETGYTCMHSNWLSKQLSFSEITKFHFLQCGINVFKLL